MTDQEKLAELRNRINEAAEQARLIPVTRIVGSGFAVAQDTVIAMPVDRWDAILLELDRA